LKSFSSPFSSTDEQTEAHEARRGLLSEEDDPDAGEEGVWDNGAIQMEVKKRSTTNSSHDNNSLDL
jgi:hypothetical protein